MQQMRSQWPAVSIREITSPDSNFCLDFDLVMQHSRVDGSLHRTGKSFHFDSDLRDAAQLALWFRALAPNTEMRERWPSARLVENEEPDSRWLFEFHLPMFHSEVSGKIERKVNAMVFTGDLRDCAELALWCRSVVPTEQLLLTCDQGDLYLKADTSADEITRTFAMTRH